MKALVYTATQEVTYRDEPEPVVNEGDALIEIEFAGICGSDMHAYLGHDPRRIPPLILGHEVVGRVLEGKTPGQKVVLNPLIACCECLDCKSGRQNLCRKRDMIGMYRPGAFAERLAIPEKNLIPIPDDYPSNHVALTEPAATVLHAILLAERNLSRPISEARALVIGGGSIGLLTALMLLDKGVRKLDVHETNSLRAQVIAESSGCSVINPLTESIDIDSYDVVFDAVGSSHTREAAVKCAKPGSCIVHIGLMDNEGVLDVRKITLQEITFIGCYTYTPMDLQMTINKIVSGALGKLDWMEERPLSEGTQAFRELLNSECAAPKILLKVGS